MFNVCVRRGSVSAAARVAHRAGVRAATGGRSGATGAAAQWRRADATLGAAGLAGGVAAMVGCQLSLPHFHLPSPFNPLTPIRTNQQQSTPNIRRPVNLVHQRDMPNGMIWHWLVVCLLVIWPSQI